MDRELATADADPLAALRTLLDERRQETEAALGIVSRITASSDVGAVLSESIRLAAAVAHADSALLYLLDDDGRRLTVRSALAADERWVDTFSLDVGGLPGWPELGAAPVLLAADDPRSLPYPGAAHAFSSVLTHPLVSPSEQLVGVIALYGEAFAGEDVVAVAPIASLAAAAVETARVHASSQRQIDVLRSVGGLGDWLVSPASTRRALHELGRATRRLLDSEVVAIYVREAHAWRLAMSLTGQDAGPDESIPFDVLDTVSMTAQPRAISLPADRLLVGAVAPSARRTTGGVLAPLRAGGQTVGALVCVGERTVPEIERELVRILATVAAMTIQTGRLVERLAAGSAELSFLEALSEGNEPSGVVAARAVQLGVDLDDAYVAAAFHVADRGGRHSDPEHDLDRLASELRGRLPASVIARRGLELLALLRVPDDGGVGERAGEALEVIERDGGIRLIGGVSGPIRRSGEHARAFREARDAVSIGKVVDGSRHLVEYDALGALRHLWTLARSPVRDPFQERVELLQSYDEEHGTQFLETVEAFLAEQGSRERASARLQIHRNTLRHRAERIREISGVDLEDRANRFELQVAVGIVRFRKLQRDGAAGAG